MKRPIYIPAAGHTTVGYLDKPDAELFPLSNRPVSPRFYNVGNGSYYSHPYILFSAAHQYNKHPDIRKNLQISNDTTVFVDSGGYQLATGVVSHKTYNSKIALDWSERNGDIFPILDHPLTPNCVPHDRLEVSIKSAEYYASHRSAANKKILNVVSANNLEGAEWWYNGIKHVKLDGWAHGGHRGNITPVIQTFLMLGAAGEFNRGYTVPYHIFGLSSQVAFIYMAALQIEANRLGWDVQIMSDSSRFQISIGHGKFFMFPSFTGCQEISISNKYDWATLHEEAVMPCNCKVCSGITDIKEFMNDPTQFYLLGAIHNLGLVLQYKQIIDNIMFCGVNEIMDNAFPPQIVKNIKAIRKAAIEPKKGAGMIYHTFRHRDLEEDNATLETFFNE